MAESIIKKDEVGLTENVARITSRAISANGTIYINHTAPVLIFTDRGGLWMNPSSDGRDIVTIASTSYMTATKVTGSGSGKVKLKNNLDYSGNVFVIGTVVATFTNS